MVGVLLKGVTKRFGDVVAVDNINIEVKEGELMGLLGPSGCGKTTTLRMIAGLETPDEGEIHIGDTLINDLSPKDRDIAMVFQFYAMYPGMNAFDQIAFPLKMRGVPKNEIERRVKEVSDILGISHSILKEPVSRLTMDQKQRLALGRAIIRRPKVYLFDEPLTNLDAKLRVHMRAEIRRLQRDLGTTSIYVTHDQLEAVSIADKIAVMNFGKITQCDKPDALYDQPKNLFVASFIGSPAMNFFDCTLIEKKGKAFLDTGEFLYNISDFADLIKEESTSPELILGVRPEHTSLTREKISEDSLKARVDIVEPIGNRMIVNLSVGKHSLKSNILAMKIDMDEMLFVTFDRRKVHVFDKKSEKTIV